MHRNQWEQHVSEQWILPSIDEKKKQIVFTMVPKLDNDNCTVLLYILLLSSNMHYFG